MILLVCIFTTTHADMNILSRVKYITHALCVYIYITPCTQPAFYAVIDSYHAIACTLPLRSFFSELLMPFLRWFKTSQDISTWTTALPAPS